MKADRDHLIKVIKDFTKLNQQYLDASNKKNSEKQRETSNKIDSMYDDILLPALTDIEYLYCKTKDSNLLDNYVKMLEVIGHSASEAPRWTFGRLYICNSNKVIEAINTSKNKKQLISDLAFGFENIVNTIDTTEYNIDNLRQKIKELK